MRGTVVVSSVVVPQVNLERVVSRLVRHILCEWHSPSRRGGGNANKTRTQGKLNTYRGKFRVF